MSFDSWRQTEKNTVRFPVAATIKRMEYATISFLDLVVICVYSIGRAEGEVGGTCEGGNVVVKFVSPGSSICVQGIASTASKGCKLVTDDCVTVVQAVLRNDDDDDAAGEVDNDIDVIITLECLSSTDQISFGITLRGVLSFSFHS